MVTPMTVGEIEISGEVLINRPYCHLWLSLVTDKCHTDDPWPDVFAVPIGACHARHKVVSGML